MLPYSHGGLEAQTPLSSPKFQTKILPLPDWTNLGHMSVSEPGTIPRKMLFVDWFKLGYPNDWQERWITMIGLGQRLANNGCGSNPAHQLFI